VRARRAGGRRRWAAAGPWGGGRRPRRGPARKARMTLLRGAWKFAGWWGEGLCHTRASGVSTAPLGGGDPARRSSGRNLVLRDQDAAPEPLPVPGGGEARRGARWPRGRHVVGEGGVGSTSGLAGALWP
jgi:hypothetical protein